MPYKKAPSIRQLNKKKDLREWREKRDNRINLLHNAMSPEQREEFDNALKNAYLKIKK